VKPTPQQLAHLREASEPQLAVSDAAWAKAVPIFSYRECAKEEYLLRAGAVGEHFYFVLQGVLRQFYTKEDGKEFNKSFSVEPEWAHFARKAAEYQTLINEEREAEFLIDSAPTRYQHFRQQHPGLEDRIPQYQIASYLGITNVALSRIRKKLGIISTS
jgi:CRP-like cAMP-binding protein